MVLSVVVCWGLLHHCVGIATVHLKKYGPSYLAALPFPYSRGELVPAFRGNSNVISCAISRYENSFCVSTLHMFVEALSLLL
jgi:hypothetical protein